MDLQPGELKYYRAEDEKVRLILGKSMDEFVRRRCDAAGSKPYAQFG